LSHKALECASNIFIKENLITNLDFFEKY